MLSEILIGCVVVSMLLVYGRINQVNLQCFWGCVYCRSPNCQEKLIGCVVVSMLVAGKRAKLPKHDAKIGCLSRFKTRFGTIRKSAVVPKIERPHAQQKKSAKPPGPTKKSAKPPGAKICSLSRFKN